MLRTRLYLLLATLAASGCDGGGPLTPAPAPAPSPGPSPSPSPSPTPVPAATVLDFSFQPGTAGWLADVSDYHQGQEAGIDFQAEHRALPAPLNAFAGYRLYSFNQSDDVFMFVSRPVTGLIANRAYRVDMDVRIGTNTPRNCAGIGGAPGEAVVMKIGATSIAPARTLDGTRVGVNFDKGNQQTSGANAINIGHIAKPVTGACNATDPYELKSLSSGSTGPTATADATGRLWLIIGFDSGYEGQTAVYLIDGQVRLTPL